MSHATLSPSGFKRVIECPASFIANMHQQSTSNAASERGTSLHNVAENMLATYCRKAKCIPVHEYDFFIGNDTPPEIIDYVRHCERLMVDSLFFAIEQRIELSTITDKVSAFGTVDFFSLSHDGVLDVVDLKTGNMIVTPTENVQLSLYAIGIIEFLLAMNPETFISQINLTIHQHGRALVETINLNTLMEREMKYKHAFILATSPNAEYRTGAHCQFCPYMAQCPEQKRKMREYLGVDMASYETKADALPTSPYEMVEFYSHKKAITAYLNAIESELKSRLLNGETIGGVELKYSSARAQWINDSDVVNYIFDNYPEHARTFVRPVTITEMRKLLGKPTVDELTVVGEPTPTLKLNYGN